MKIVILGLTITSSWGNGHATTYRSLCRALHAQGHVIEFLEKDVEWYASHRDLESPAFARVTLYRDWARDGRALCSKLVLGADVIVVGSYFPDAVVATYDLLESKHPPILFYDIDTPITISSLRTEGRCAYLEASLIPAYSAYMSFTSGPLLHEIEHEFGSPYAVALHCSVDTSTYSQHPVQGAYAADLSYLGTYAADRQAKLGELLGRSAECLRQQSFLVAGPMYPEDLHWSPNVRTLSHVPPSEHPAFYSSARFSLNLTRADMVAAGFSRR